MHTYRFPPPKKKNGLVENKKKIPIMGCVFERNNNFSKTSFIQTAYDVPIKYDRPPCAAFAPRFDCRVILLFIFECVLSSQHDAVEKDLNQHTTPSLMAVGSPWHTLYFRWAECAVVTSASSLKKTKLFRRYSFVVC